MDIYVIMQVIILFGAIFLGVRLGGMGIGYAGGLGVVLLSLGMGMFPGQIPWDVILDHYVGYRSDLCVAIGRRFRLFGSHCRKYFA